MMKETLKHKEAFEFYYTLGKERSLKAVAEKFGVSDQAAKNWSKNFNWQYRVEQRDIELARKLQQKTDDIILATKADYRKIVKAGIAKWIANFKAGKINPTSVSDLEKLVKLDLLLMGENTENIAAKEIVHKIFYAQDDAQSQDQQAAGEGAEQA